MHLAIPHPATTLMSSVVTTCDVIRCDKGIYPHRQKIQQSNVSSKDSIHIFGVTIASLRLTPTGLGL